MQKKYGLVLTYTPPIDEDTENMVSKKENQEEEEAVEGRKMNKKTQAALERRKRDADERIRVALIKR